MLDKIDLGNSRTLTILIIVCILIFTCIYVMVNNQNNLEGFAESVLETGDTVRLKDGLKSVILGSGTSTNNANDYINSLMPAMTIVAYNGDAAPTGWQICDGKPLKYTNGDPVLSTDGNSFINTPNLKGRAIIGANPTVDTTNGISVRNKGESGGAETHKLTTQEMPSHNHNFSLRNDRIGCIGTNCGAGGSPGGGLFYTRYNYVEPSSSGITENSGNTLPHNNMQPYYVLNYIIKQPSK
jgi:microcystin-dependent protein